MKTLFATLSIAATTGLALANPSTEFVDDKPDFVYLAGDSLRTETLSVSTDTGSDGTLILGRVSSLNSYQWEKELGGNGLRDYTEESERWDTGGFQWGWTNHDSSQLTWGTNGLGIEVHTNTDGSVVTYDPIGLPVITGEHSVFNTSETSPATWQSLGNGQYTTNRLREDYHRYGQTQWRLQTGGRARRASLFQLCGAVEEILDKNAQRPFTYAEKRTVEASNIRILGQTLRDESKIWVVLPDGASIDLTPVAAGVDFYTATITAQKYAPSITVNEFSDLGHCTPEYCAGEQLRFDLVFDPPAPFTQRITYWALPGNPVNERIAGASGGSASYRMNAALLANPSTSCWYPGNDGGRVICGANLQFANGQQTALAIMGHFTVASPVLTEFVSSPSEYEFSWSSPVLQLGVQWHATLGGGVDGLIGVTQLIAGTNSYCNTGGDFYLDGNNELYNGTEQPYIVTNSTTRLFNFSDTRTATAAPTANLSAVFKDYLRFKPAGNASNIWVSVGTMTWAMDGSATLSSGVTQSNCVPAGPLMVSAEFPAWTNRFSP